MIQNSTKMMTTKPRSFLRFIEDHHPSERDRTGPCFLPYLPQRHPTCEPDKRVYAKGVYKIGTGHSE
jgi:hypothetical protein